MDGWTDGRSDGRTDGRTDGENLNPHLPPLLFRSYQQTAKGASHQMLWSESELSSELFRDLSLSVANITVCHILDADSDFSEL